MAGFVSSLLLAGPTLVGAADLPALIYPNFHNSLGKGAGNPPVTSSSSAAMFTGTMGEYSPPGSGAAPVVPSGGTNRLVESYFGQTFSENIPYPGFETNAIAMAQVLLYPPPTFTNPTDIANGDTAFRYKEIQYGRTDGQVRLNYESIASLFGSAERAKIAVALTKIREALKYAPFSRELRNALLDIYYDWTVAELQLAKEKRADTARYRLGLIPILPNEFIIDREIANQTNILAQYEAIWTSYSGLLSERAGVDMQRFVPGETLPLGSFIFREEQPFRNQLAAYFWDTDGIRKTFSSDGSVTTGPAPTLFAGYKDYVTLLSLIRDYVDTAQDVVKLYAMRGRVSPGVNDPAAAAALMRRAQTETLDNLAFLRELLPNARTAASDASGVRAAWDGILTAMSELEGAAGFLRGDKNALGFDPDMLVLFQSPPGANQVADSYDAIMQWINPDVTGSTVLGFARDRFDEAIANYETYRGYADQLATQMTDINNSYGDRYHEITGYGPEEGVRPWPNPKPTYPPVPDGAGPTHITYPGPGSELYNAYQEVIHADTQKAQIDRLGPVLNDQLRLVSEGAKKAGYYDDNVKDAADKYMQAVRVNHGIMTAASAAMAGSQVTYDMTVDTISAWAGDSWTDLFAAAGAGTVAIGVVGSANLLVQWGGEIAKGTAGLELVLANAVFQRDIALAGSNQELLAVQLEYRNVVREKISHKVELNEVAQLRSNAEGTVAALLRELNRIESDRSESDSALAGRYFADPIHFLRAQNSVIKADFAFREAQRWVFFALRALEYKYNKTFAWDDGNRTWDVSSLYGLRNFEELSDMLAAMNAFNALNSGNLAFGRVSFTDRISLRQDVWRLGTNDASLLEFRTRLTNTFNPGRGFYEITLNTLVLSDALNERPDRAHFFTAPVYDLQGNVSADKGNYADKIDWIKFQFIDRSLSSSGPPMSGAGFKYGGVSYDRSFCARDLDSQAQAAGELRSFPFRHFVTGGTSTRDWASFQSQDGPVDLTFSPLPQEPVGGAATSWRERSVAASRWTLEIPAHLLNPDRVDDLVIYVHHSATPRKPCP